MKDYFRPLLKQYIHKSNLLSKYSYLPEQRGTKYEEVEMLDSQGIC
jgi:hypothetical protein